MNILRSCLVLLAYPMCAQLPPGWFQREPLGQPGAPAWWGGGQWAGDGQGPPATLVDSLGLGNALTGAGVHLEGGFRAGSWDFAGELLAAHQDGASWLTLYRSHAWWRGRSGWQGGFEQEPLVWGYGLNGGYTLGEAARPFPRLRLESPYRSLSLFKVPLGSWSFQTFLGRMENHRVLSDSIQDGAWRMATINRHGDPQAPLLSGYRAQARFGQHFTFYLNWLNLWSGTRNGVGVTQGYNLGEYLTAMFGLKDSLSQASTDPSEALLPTSPVNRAQSASEMDWGLRMEAPCLARFLGAGQAWLWVSRGSKSEAWPIGLFLRNPPRYLASDVATLFRNLATGKFGFNWNYNAWYSIPSEITPNDNVGLLLAWPRLRLGAEYLDTSNNLGQGHRSFAHENYLTGFYYHGDPLGEALAGETRATTVRVELDASSRLTLVGLADWGIRPFRDTPDLWQAAHPGAQPWADRIFGAQQALRWRLGRGLTLDTGSAWQRHGAVDYMAGRTGNGFRWFTDLAWRWPGR